MIPALTSPMNAINRPIPADTALFIAAGMASMIASRILVTVRMIKMIPSMNTAVNANCQLYPMVRHTVYTKNAFRPRPGARAKGFFA